MKILHAVESYYPAQNGMAEVVKQISERLIQKGHSITVATSINNQRTDKTINGVKIEEFNIGGGMVQGYRASAEELERYRQFLINSDFDLIVGFAAQQWSFDLMTEVLGQIKAKKVFVPTGFSRLTSRKFKNYYNLMKVWLTKFDANIFSANVYQDIDFARKNNAPNIFVIPNAADEHDFLENSTVNLREKLGIPRDSFLIFHLGGFTGLKGHYEAFKIFKKAKITNSVMLFSGYMHNNLLNLKTGFEKKLIQNFYDDKLNRRCIIATLEKNEKIAAFKTADLFLFTSNIECSPLVLFEAMASKTPFLTTDVGNSPEIVEWSKSGFVMPTRKIFGLSIAKINKSVRLLEETYKNKNLRIELAENGYKNWLDKFTWEKVAKQYEVLFESILQ